MRTGRRLADLSAGLIERVPQVLVQRGGADPHRLAGADAVWEAVREVEAALGDRAGCCSGRAAPSRWSGSWWRRTEDEAAEAAVERICDAVEGSLGNGR